MSMAANNKPTNPRRKVRAAKQEKSEISDEKNSVSQSEIVGSISEEEKDSDTNKSKNENDRFNSFIGNNKKSLILFMIFILTIFLISSFILSIWFYKFSLKQSAQLQELTLRLNNMPSPVSQGRLGLIINKSNKNLEKKVSEELLSLEQRIKEIEQKLNLFPKPLSEGKVGLILDHRIKNFKKDLEKQIDRALNSLESKNETSPKNDEFVLELRENIKELEKSLEDLGKIVGFKKLSKSLTEEIEYLKVTVKELLAIDFHTELSQKKLNPDLDKAEEFSLIVKEFSEYAYKAIKADLRSNAKDGIFNSVINRFQLAFVQRSLTPQKGNSVDAILSRAEHALNIGEYQKVIDELNELPKGASEVMMDWTKKFEELLEEKR